MGAGLFEIAKWNRKHKEHIERHICSHGFSSPPAAAWSATAYISSIPYLSGVITCNHNSGSDSGVVIRCHKHILGCAAICPGCVSVWSFSLLCWFHMWFPCPSLASFYDAQSQQRYVKSRYCGVLKLFDVQKHPFFAYPHCHFVQGCPLSLLLDLYWFATSKVTPPFHSVYCLWGVMLHGVWTASCCCRCFLRFFAFLGT